MSLRRVFAPIATATTRRKSMISPTNNPHSLENIFISGLVAAGTCHHHRQSKYQGQERRRKTSTPIQRRHYSAQTSPPPPAPPPQSTSASVHISREEYNDLVDVYPDFTPDDDTSSSTPPPVPPPPPSKPPHFPLASRLTLTPEQESDLPPEIQEHHHTPHPPEDAFHASQIDHLNHLLRKPLGHISHSKLWQIYQSLPAPRPAYLSTKTLNRLFRHLAWTEFKSTPDAMTRYFHLLNEVLSHPTIPLQDGIWNSAIAFAGRWMRHVRSAEVKSAVGVWMRMEERGVQASEVTFNILYDLAVRAGRFALAGTIETELRTRGLPLNRYFRTSVIYHAGLRRDGEGVRRAFRELVDAGEIVDTAVMNCVILSLLRAGEAGAAGSVFLRMKKLHEEKFGGDALRDWREGKLLGIHLDAEAKRLREEEGVHERSFFGGTFSSRGKRDAVQRSAPIEPDGRTYRILIGWAVECGELGKARELVEEMRGKGWRVYGSVWVGILRGFGKFGGFVGGEWSLKALEEVWGEVLGSLEEPPPISPSPSPDSSSSYTPIEPNTLPTDYDEPSSSSEDDDGDEDTGPLPETSRPTYFTRTLALATVNAFYKCTGRKRMLEVWEDVEHRWSVQRGGVSEEELEGVRRVVEGLRGFGEEREYEEDDNGGRGGREGGGGREEGEERQEGGVGSGEGEGETMAGEAKGWTGGEWG